MLSIINNKSQIAFTADPKKALWRISNGIPDKLTARYVGYTGPKNFSFPTSPDLEKHLYPDVTKYYDEMISKIVKEVNQKLGKNPFINFYKKCNTFLKNFKTADPWDTKFLENFPGRTSEGKVQYALLKDKIVNANYISNALYGDACIKMGFKEWFATLAAKVDAHGLSNLFTEGKIPQWQDVRFKDTAADQNTIKSAYRKLKDSLNTSKANGFNSFQES